MSAFRDLLKQAHEKGARYLRFEVDLDAFFESEENPSWDVADTDKDAYMDYSTGRTGEEALRRLVEKLP